MFQSNIKNQQLKQIHDGIESSVKPELREGYDQIMTAGMKLLTSESTSKFLVDRIKAAKGNVVEAISTGIPDLLIILYHESNKTMSIPAAPLAALSLMAEALDIAEQIGLAKVTPQVIDQCAENLSKSVPERFGISQDQVNNVMAHGANKQGLLNSRGA